MVSQCHSWQFLAHDSNMYAPVSKGTTNKQEVFPVESKRMALKWLFKFCWVPDPVEVCRTHQISLFTELFPWEDAAKG